MTRSPTSKTVLRFLPHLGLLLAVIAVVLLALVPISWRGGWWPYRFSLLSLMAYSAYFGIATVSVSVPALVISGLGRRGIAVAMLAFAAGGLTAYVPWHYRALATRSPTDDRSGRSRSAARCVSCSAFRSYRATRRRGPALGRR